ncbi:hypothetical protein [Streptomyces sp. NPDC058953]|uniref:hypothetical protein n=1 Tax=Streptomyces sp. NPDC058953 TaxID=3346676 RepID=UPI0036A00E15
MRRPPAPAPYDTTGRGPGEPPHATRSRPAREHRRPVPAAARAELLRRAERAPHPLALFAEVSARLRRLLPYDAAVWRATDPETGIMTAPVHTENADADGCAAYWDVELFAERVNRFPDLARRPVPVAGLWESTGGEPERGSVYGGFLRARGLGDELRMVLALDGRPQATVSLFRAEGRPVFGAADTAFAASLVVPLARRLRAYAVPRTPEPPGDTGLHGRPTPATPASGPDAAPAHDREAVPAYDPGTAPGLLLFDASGALVFADDTARHHLDRVPAAPGPPARPRGAGGAARGGQRVTTGILGERRTT